MMEEIAAKLASWSPATVVAYSGLSFDEEHLRHALYANLHPPYPTQRPGNDRALLPEALTALGRNQPGLAHAYALARWGGFRRGTICRVPLNAWALQFDLAGVPQGRLFWLTEKRKVRCDKREDARLSELLDATPGHAPTSAYNADGFAWKPRQLAQAVERQNERLAKAKARLGLSLHGLRHSRGVELARAGVSDAEIMSPLEHATDRAARIYRRQAERRRLADSAQGRINSVIAIRARKSDQNWSWS